jgi:hypothetical protein
MSRLEDNVRQQKNKESVLISNFRFKLNSANSKKIFYEKNFKENFNKTKLEDLELCSDTNKKPKIGF